MFFYAIQFGKWGITRSEFTSTAGCMPYKTILGTSNKYIMVPKHTHTAIAELYVHLCHLNTLHQRPWRAFILYKGTASRDLSEC